MRKALRDKILKGFQEFMEERGAMPDLHGYGVGDRDKNWIIKTPFGPVWVKIDPAEDARDSFALFCQLTIYPSSYPNPDPGWYQWRHHKQNCHPGYHPDAELLLEHLKYHVLKFFSTHKGQPDDRELWLRTLEACERASFKTKTILEYFKHYEMDQKEAEPAAEAA